MSELGDFKTRIDSYASAGIDTGVLRLLHDMLEVIEGDGWRDDLENMPKDGTRILVTDGTKVGFVYFRRRWKAAAANTVIDISITTRWKHANPPKETHNIKDS